MNVDCGILEIVAEARRRKSEGPNRARITRERLGHASVGFTLDTYGHVLPGQQAEVAAAVAKLVDG